MIALLKLTSPKYFLGRHCVFPPPNRTLQSKFKNKNEYERMKISCFYSVGKE